jgi:hypothetical protein
VRDLILDLVVRHGFQVVDAVVIQAVGAIVARWAGQVTLERLEPWVAASDDAAVRAALYQALVERLRARSVEVTPPPERRVLAAS